MATPPSKSIYIKGSPVNVGEEAVKDAVKSFGAVTSVTVPDDRDFCFVEFESEDAANAAAEAGSVTIGGQSATVEIRKGSRRGGAGGGRDGGGRGGARAADGAGSHSIYIHAVADEATKEDLASAFGAHGDVVRSQFRTSVQGRKYAFVEFESADVVAVVISGGPYKVAGQDITVEERHSAPRTRAPREGGGQSNGGGRANGRGDADGKPRGRLAIPPKPEHSVYIKGFPADTTEEAIRDIFGKHGDIKSVIVRVKKHFEDDSLRTWAFVEYAGVAGVDAAVAATAGGFKMGGEEVVVEARKSEPKLFRGGGRGPRGGGGGGRRRNAGDS